MHRSRLSSIPVVGVLLATTLMSGCVVGPNYQKSALLLPAAWAHGRTVPASAAPPIGEWWKQLKDPVLDGIVEKAVAGNIDEQTARARIRQARATYRQTTGADLPQVDGSTSATRSRTAQTGAFSTQFQAGLDASWEIDLFGLNARTKEASRHAVEAAEEDLRDIHLTLLGDLATNYVNIRGYQARIALARRTADSQRTTLELTKSKMDAGAASMLDVSNAKALVSTTESAIPDLETAYMQAVNRMGVLTGDTPEALAGLLSKVRPVPSARAVASAVIPAEVIVARPDVRAAERRYAQANASVGVARANRYPSVSLTGQISTAAAHVGDLAKASSVSWSFGPSVTVPVFDAGRLAAAEDVAIAEKDVAFLAYRASVLTALSDVENALVSTTQDRKKQRTLEASSEAYQQVVSLTRSSYQDGASDFFEVETAERSAYSAQDDIIQGRVALATDFIALNKALGGSWEGAETKAR